MTNNFWKNLPPMLFFRTLFFAALVMKQSLQEVYVE